MRIVSLSPSLSDILADFQIIKETVGITEQCPAELFPATSKVGSPKALCCEKIANLHPDCILACDSDNRPEQIRELKKKFPVRSFAVRSIPAVLDTIHDLGRFMQKPEEARALKNKILIEQDKSRQAAEGKKPVPTLVLIWNQPFLTVNFDTYISRLIEASGGYNVFHSDPLPEFPVELEDMLEKGPQLLLLPSAPFPFKKSHVAYFRKYRIFSSIPIEIVKGDLFSRFGPKTAEALRILRSLIAEKAIPSVAG